MTSIKTKVLEKEVLEFLNEFSENQKKDALELIKIFQRITKSKPKIWSNGTIGFGSFYYKSEKSKQEGEWMSTGFAIRKQNITIYIMSGFSKLESKLKKLGKHKISGGSCIYIKKLEDIDSKILEEIIEFSLKLLSKKYQIKK